VSERTPEDIQFINRELLLHNQWLTRKGGRRCDLSFRDLSGMDFSGIRLSGAKLVGADLARAKLVRCELMATELFGADLEGADLTGANLAGADFRGANLHRAILTDSVLRGADFSTDVAVTSTLKHAAHHGPTVMSEARLERAVLCQANLSGCDLSGSDLDEADLKGADLTKAVLLGVELGGADLEGATLSGTVLEIDRLTPEQRASLGDQAGGASAPAYSTVSSETLENALAAHDGWIASNGTAGRRMEMEFADLSGVDLSGRDLSGVRLRRCGLRGVDLSSARLDMADLSYCDLTEANLEQASLRGVSLRRATLRRARLAAARLDAMPLVGGREWPANLEGAVLHDADLTNAVLASAVLRRADIGGCLTHGASFRGVDLETTKRTAPGVDPLGPRERRRMRRFQEPVLSVRTEFGAFPTVDWSFGGLRVALSPERVAGALPKRGSPVTLVVSTAEAPGDGVPVSAILTGADATAATLSFRFVKLEEELKALLNPLAPARYRTR